MERVFYASDLAALKDAGTNFDRAYFGVEFCPELIGESAELTAALALTRRRGLSLSLMTPWCREDTFARLRRLLRILPSGSEVIINDWGTADLAREIPGKRFALVFGRLLVRGKRDPREPRDPGARAHLRTTNISSQAFQDFLRGRGFERVELENVWQGHRLPARAALKRSLYYPFVFTSVTAKCLFKTNPAGARCGRACQGKPLLCEIPGVKRPLLTRGNAEFYRNDERPPERALHAWRIDRLVFRPSPPL